MVVSFSKYFLCHVQGISRPFRVSSVYVTATVLYMLISSR